MIKNQDELVLIKDGKCGIRGAHIKVTAAHPKCDNMLVTDEDGGIHKVSRFDLGIEFMVVKTAELETDEPVEIDIPEMPKGLNLALLKSS